jgi:hypothetical protein
MARKIALGIFLLAIIFFMLPWVSVSCAGQDIVQVSGFDMVSGSYNIPAEDEFVGVDAESEPLAIWALVAAGVGVFVSLITWKIGYFLRIFSGLAGIGLLIALKIKLNNDFSSELTGEMAGFLQLKYLVGYWLTLVAFAAAVIVSAIRSENGVKTVKTSEAPGEVNQPPADKPPPT